MNTQDMHNALIVAKVKIKTGMSLRKLSTSNGLNVAACQVALSRPYAAPEKVIANAIGIPEYEIWPSRYNKDGTRKKGLHAKTSASITNNCTSKYTNLDEGEQ